LNEEWDQIPEVRRRVLAGNMFLKQPDQPWALPTRDNAKLNKEVLIPCLHRLSATPDYHLPHLPALHVEIHLLHNKMGKEISPKYLYQCAIELKKFLSFIKRRATHKEVTKDCSFKRPPQKMLHILVMTNQILFGKINQPQTIILNMLFRGFSLASGP